MNEPLAILFYYLAAKRNRNRWRSRIDLERWQDHRVQKHLAALLPRSPVYQKLYADRPLSGWRDFPVADKSLLMANFNDWNTVGIDHQSALSSALAAERSRDFAPTIGNITVGLSSGTSGSRSLFLVSPGERRAWAGTMLTKILPDSILARHRAALCFRANSNLYSSVASRRFQFRFFDLLDPPEKLAQKLGEYRPTLLIAPPALLRILAEEKKAGRLNIHPTRIFSVAEVLEPQERQIIETSFSQRLHEIYQATEGFLATTCREGRLHLNEDIIVVQKEWLDRARRKFVPIITDFRRTTQPILRYRLNDILTEHTNTCPCGSIFTALEQIEGRCDDVLNFSDNTGNQMIPVFPDFIRRAVIMADPAITEYSVTYRSPENLEVELAVPASTRSGAEKSVRAELLSLCEKLDCRCPEIVFKPFAPPPLHTKRRRIIAIHHRQV